MSSASGPPASRRAAGVGDAGGDFSGPFSNSTVNLQTIYPNKGGGGDKKKRHRKQMNTKHQLPGPDLERPPAQA